ncbi:hypothetical protein ACHAWF_014252, partial [Thalassiosira exigua]
VGTGRSGGSILCSRSGRRNSPARTTSRVRSDLLQRPLLLRLGEPSHDRPDRDGVAGDFSELVSDARTSRSGGRDTARGGGTRRGRRSTRSCGGVLPLVPRPPRPSVRSTAP